MPLARAHPRAFAPWRHPQVAPLLVALCTLGCHAVFELERPPNANAPAVLLIVGSGERAVAVRAIDAAAPDWSPLSARAGEILYAVSFSCGVERLGLVPGTQALTEDRAIDMRTPPHAALFERAADTDDAPWRASADVPPAVDDGLGRLPLPPEARCRAVGARYTSTPVDLPRDEERGEPAFALVLDDQRVLAGTRAGKLFLVMPDATAVPITQYRDRLFRTGVRGPDGALWMIDARGAMWRGNLDDGFTVVTSSAPFGVQQQRIASAASRGDAPFEVFATAETERGDVRSFHRFDGQRWTKLAEFNPQGDTIFLPALAWVGPGEAVAIGVHPGQLNGVARYRQGVLIPEPLPGPSGPASIVHHPTLGTFVGRDDGEINRYFSTRWTSFGTDVARAFVRTFLIEGEGFLYTWAPEINFVASAVGQYQPSIGFCTSSERYTQTAISNLTRVSEDTVVVLSAAGFGDPMDITVLRRTQAAGSCSLSEP